MNGSVEVLMSTYRGASHLDCQINSILAQTWDQLALRIRDDGSADATVDALRARADAPRIRVEFGANVGVFASFFRLLAQADPAASFYAFSDQDDYWMPGKIEAAVRRLASQPDRGKPLLYCGRQLVADANLAVVGTSPNWPRAPDWRNALVENVATGCTIVMDRRARDLLLSVSAPEGLVHHDWWCYLVISAFGRVVFDATPHILYRQHGTNSLGVGATPLARFRRKVRRAFAANPARYGRQQAAEFLRLYGSGLSDGQRRTVGRLADPAGGFGARADAARDPNLWRQHPLDDLVLRATLLVR